MQNLKHKKITKIKRVAKGDNKIVLKNDDELINYICEVLDINYFNASNKFQIIKDNKVITVECKN